MYIVLLGPPGAGKGSQAPLLAQEMGGLHISTGDMLRAAVKEATPYGLKGAEYMRRGDLVPDDLVLAMLMERLSEYHDQNVVLDGFPRTLVQAQALDAAMARAGKSLECAINFRVSEDVLLSRLSGRWTCSCCGRIYHEQFNPSTSPGACDVCDGQLRQREDDRREAVKRRLQVYVDETAPLLDFYRSDGRLEEINGNEDFEAVTRALLDVLERRRGAESMTTELKA